MQRQHTNARQQLMIGLSGLAGTIAMACGPTMPRPDPNTPAWSLVDEHTSSRSAPFLVSPEWSATGNALIARGHLGLGRYRVDLASLKVVATEPQQTQNPSSDALANADEAGRAFLTPSGPNSIWFEPYHGRVLAGAPGGPSRVLAAADAWGVRVSPNGRAVAYCVGHLPRATLHIVSATGRTWYMGRGAQPAWLPDSRHVVFTVPVAHTDKNGRSQLVDANLQLVEIRSGREFLLTHTPGRVDMEPTINPAGEQLAFADWKSGRLHVARLTTPGGRK